MASQLKNIKNLPEVWLVVLKVGHNGTYSLKACWQAEAWHVNSKQQQRGSITIESIFLLFVFWVVKGAIIEIQPGGNSYLYCDEDLHDNFLPAIELRVYELPNTNVLLLQHNLRLYDARVSVAIIPILRYDSLPYHRIRQFVHLVIFICLVWTKRLLKERGSAKRAYNH